MSVETAKAKIERESASCGGLEKALAAHLVSIMDDELAALVEREDYTVKEMGAFVMAKARKQLNGQSGYLADEVVYGFATDYYHATREEIKKNGTVYGGSAAQAKDPVQNTAAEKKPQKKDAKREKHAEKAPTPAPKPAKKSAPEGQMSLFDMLGGFANA